MLKIFCAALALVVLAACGLQPSNQTAPRTMIVFPDGMIGGDLGFVVQDSYAGAMAGLEVGTWGGEAVRGRSSPPGWATTTPPPSRRASTSTPAARAAPAPGW